MDDPAEVDGPDAPPRRSSGLTFVGLLVGAILVTVLIGQLSSPDPSPRPPTAVATTAPDLLSGPAPDKPIGVESIKRCPVQLGGLTLGDHRQIAGSALVRWDCNALKGPWSVVIRATGGSLGVDAAVVTFPVAQVRSGTPLTRPQGAVWRPDEQVLVWPLAGSHAQIVGDLGQAELADLAMTITVAAGKPHLPALDGFTAAPTITYRPPVVHEMRYGTNDLGHASTLGGGLVHTGVMSGAEFESMAFESHAKPAGFVRGKPAIYSDVQGGNGTLAWESAPGQVAYIGYSGAETSARAIEALRAMADKGRLLTPAQWEAKDRYSVDAKSG
jgi:hypothetical protein